MAKIILAFGNKVVREIRISARRVTIGRRPQNDIVIDDLAVSGEHAVIVTSDDDSFLEDLNSTNGTKVNGQPIKKHFLQDNDVIELAQYKMTFIASSSIGDRKGLEDEARVNELGKVSGSLAVVKVLSGPTSGQEISLSKVLTTIGKPGVQVALVAQKEKQFVLTHIEGEERPVVNGKPVSEHFLADGDLIVLASIEMRFCRRD